MPNLITEYYAVANYIHLLCLNITEIVNMKITVTITSIS